VMPGLLFRHMIGPRIERGCRKTRLMLAITFVLVMLCQGQAQERGSAKYMLPFYQTWLKVAAERDLEVRGSILKTEQPMRLIHRRNARWPRGRRCRDAASG
jgi:hypothetical protein